MRFRTKSIEVEAIQVAEVARLLTEEQELPAWLATHLEQEAVEISEREATFKAFPGLVAKSDDWLLRGPNDACLPCSGENFAKMYEPVD